MVGAAVERAAALLGAELDDVAAILGALDARGESARASALGEATAAEEWAGPSLADEHHGAALVADFIGGDRRLLVATQRTRIVALGSVLAREVRSEDAALRHQPTAILRTALGFEHGEVVRPADEIFDVGLSERFREWLVEVLEHASPAKRSLFDLVELSFHAGSERDVEDVGELVDHDLGHGLAERRGSEATLLEEHVTAIDQYRDDGRVGGWAPDAESFELLHQTGFTEARRRFGEVLPRNDFAERYVFLRLEHGERLLIFERAPIALLVCLAIEGEEALELDDAPGRAKEILAEVEVDGRGVEDSRRHLGSHEALPDELVELELIGREVALDVLRPARWVGGSHRLVRVLGVRLTGLSVQASRRSEEILAEERLQVVARLTRSAFRDARGVGTHVRDEPDGALGADVDALVEHLRDAHRALGTEADLLGGFLLHGTRSEWRSRILAALASADVGDRERLSPLEVREDRLRLALVGDLRLLTLYLVELGREALLGLLEKRLDGPVLHRLERTDFALALDDESERHGLYAAGGEPLLDGLP